MEENVRVRWTSFLTNREDTPCFVPFYENFVPEQGILVVYYDKKRKKFLKNPVGRKLFLRFALRRCIL
jgi:hypothetical protein